MRNSEAVMNGGLEVELEGGRVLGTLRGQKADWR